MNAEYEVWCYPTEINKTSKARQIGGTYSTLEEARDAKWFDEQDEPSPDKHDYFTWVIEEKRTPQPSSS
jgi:hypothetical protein